jgi:ferrochelatase
VTAALLQIPAERRGAARLVFTAHSIPERMARPSPYERQLREACRLVGERAGRAEWDLAYQSRSGPPSQPWLGPDIGDHLRALASAGTVRDVVLVPIGFLCEHMEVVYDLDVEAAAVCEALGLNMVRAGVAGCHPRFVRMIRELIDERLIDRPVRSALGADGPWPDQCPPGCCRSD